MASSRCVVGITLDDPVATLIGLAVGLSFAGGAGLTKLLTVLV